MNWDIVFEPALPPVLLAALGVAAVIVLIFSFWRRARGAPWRAGAFALLMLALLNPTIRQEDRTPVPDVAAIVVDESQSQQIGERPAQTEAALRQLEKEIAATGEIETRIVRVRNNPGSENGTALFTALENALTDVPRERIAGAVLLTDGQVHDVPKSAQALGFDAPVHALVTGHRNEHDRRLTVVEAPRFGIVDEPLSLSFRVDETGTKSEGIAPVTISVDGEKMTTANATIGQTTTVTLSLSHGGPNVIEVDVAPGPEELTMLNNRAVMVANGIRDRLRVLLVSGEPHPGERTWRNLLKADPAVDLVHFTILRPPEKQDATPVGELSLIAFPTRELFSEKLDQFDLIIFDRYKRRGVLPLAYLSNIVDYVEKGGAILAAAGPAFASPYSIYRTPLSGILPARPTGDISIGGFKPEVTKMGRKHPVTAGLPGERPVGDTQAEADWGRWFRTIDTATDSGETVMDTPDGKPLVVLDRAGEGRVAQLLSDQVWLWSRGFEGGGPYAELLRRLAHWLMKEPDLEEERLSASTKNGVMTVNRRTMADETPSAEVTLPSGKTEELKLTETAPGLFEASLRAEELGLYRIRQGELSAVAAAGPLNPREFADVRATDAKLKGLVTETGGGLWWLGDGAEDMPSLRMVRAGHDAAGSDWFGLRRNEQYLVNAVHQVPLMTGLVALALILGSIALAWHREGR